MALIVHQFPCLQDNYGFLVHDEASGETAAIDTPDSAEYLRQAAGRGWRITQVWNTHWHPDHAGGNSAIVAATGAMVTAPADEGERIPVADRRVAHGDMVGLGESEAEVIAVGGHTLGHVAYHFADGRIAFVGDTLFALGCGRLFEGTPAMMWESLGRLRALPEDTVLYCAHEYTASNARFALSVDTANPDLAAYAAEVTERRARSEPTVPTRLDREIAANPFLRASEPAMQAAMGHPGDPVATFAELRARKDSF